MTTTVKKTSKTPAARKSATHPEKAAPQPLRIRPELLPDTATYGTFAGKEYVMIPVEDFGDWYEDVTLGAIAQDRLEMDEGPVMPLGKLARNSNLKGKRKADT